MAPRLPILHGAESPRRMLIDESKGFIFRVGYDQMASVRLEAIVAAELHVKEIRTKKFAIGKKEPNPLTEDLHHAVTSLSAELYTKDVHFLMELIQNAEDNAYPAGVQPTLEFVLTSRDITRTGAPSTLLVFNNEVGFSRKNMDSICSVGRSTKKGKRQLGFIGEKGIGFKSVFLVSTQPHIFSNGYKVKFNEAPNQDCGIGYIVPEWVWEIDIVLDVHKIYGTNKILPTTAIVLPLKPEKVEAVKTQLSELHPELLLFLSKIKRLSVRAKNNDPKEAENVSAIFISNETDQGAFASDGAHSCVVRLSAKNSLKATKETCKYFMWRQAFRVKPENRISTRNDVEDWNIALAFPFGKRLKTGSSSIGIFAFLPTAMVTNFPFIIQSDFILASSRETILLDNKWNMGILGCVPSAFFSAFSFCVRKGSPLLSVAQAFEFLPAQASPIPELKNMRESIKIMMQKARIMPCEMFCGRERYCKPGSAIRIQRKFHDLLSDVQKEGITLKGMFPMMKKVPVHSSLDLERYRKVLDYLGVGSDSESKEWYVQCIQTFNFILQASEDAYVKLLCFIADMNLASFHHLSFLKYVNGKGKVELRISSSSDKILYAVASRDHAWLIKWNKQLGCQGGMYFLPISTQKAIISHERSSNLRSWLSSIACVNCYTVFDYAREVCHVLSSRNQPKLAIDCAHFVYHSYSKKFITESELNYLSTIMPIVDGSGCLRKQRSVTLVPASRSKWATLFGPFNPFLEKSYIDIGEAYAQSYQFVGGHTPEKELLDFLVQHFGAQDLPELRPPDMVLPLTTCLTSEQAFLLLDWIRNSRTRGLSIPRNFFKGIKDGRWMKTYLGFSCPSQSVLLDTTGTIVFEMMKSVLDDFFVLDQEFYTDCLCSYVDELKYLGVRFGFDDLQRLLATRFKTLTSSSLRKEHTYSLLMFISISREKKLLDQEWLDDIKEGKWLRTSQGYNAPNESLFLQSETEAEAVLKITNIPVVDESFYGSKLSSFSSELILLGVMLDVESVYDLIAQNLTFPADVASITGNCGLLILSCIRNTGSAASGFIESFIQQRWLKTTSGVECPPKCILYDVEWDSLYSIVDVPIIDEGFYDNKIRAFMAELEAVRVAVNFESAFQLIIAQFKLLSSSKSLTPANIISLLICIREVNQKRPSQLSEFRSSLLGEMWLKTRCGYRAPNESILFTPKWATVSLFVDLPFIDDSFYSISIYGYRDELKILGVVIDFMEGSFFVARGLKHPINTDLITRDSAISLLDCFKCLMSGCNEQEVFVDFHNNLRRSKWLNTTFGYRNPEQCILFDPAWEVILQRTDVPSIDESFYYTDFSVYKNQLRAIGVKVDPGDVCSLLLRLLSSKTETSCIERVYSFLSKFHLNQESADSSDSQVWIRSGNGAGKGKWMGSHLCVLYDKYKLFGSRLYALEDYYGKELLPMFTSIFGVAKFPSTNDYLQLWNDWSLRINGQLTAHECFSFFGFVLDNLNPSSLETLKKNLSKLPATTCTSEEIFLVSREEVFLPDDLKLKWIFKNVGVPLFTWLPKQSSFSPAFSWRLYEVYHSLGVRKISESVECKVDHNLFPNYQSQMFIDLRNRLFEKGLLKIILAFLAGPMMKMPTKERHKAAKSLLDLTVFETEKSIQVNYQLLLCQTSRTLEARRKKMVLWERNLRRLFLDKSGFEGWKTNIEFVSAFAQEISEGLLSHGQAEAIDCLSKLIQIGFTYEYKEDAVEFLLIKENLELLVEDTQFLDAAIRKRTHPRSEQLGPLTPVASSKKLRQ